MISRYSDFPSKHGLRPESPVASIIRARQKIFSGKGGRGSKRSRLATQGWPQREVRFTESPITSHDLESRRTPQTALENGPELTKGNSLVCPLHPRRDCALNRLS